MVEISALLLVLFAISSVLCLKPLPYPGQEEDRLLPPGAERTIGIHICRWDGDCWRVKPAPRYKWDPELCVWIDPGENGDD